MESAEKNKINKKNVIVFKKYNYFIIFMFITNIYSSYFYVKNCFSSLLTSVIMSESIIVIINPIKKADINLIKR